MIHSFLIIGQSNMAGRGFINEVEPIKNENILLFRNGRWHKLFFPVNHDGSTAGVNLSESFADAYAKEKNVKVGIIPCASGGTMLDQWCRGSLLYDNAIYQTRLAMRTSNIAGILWHQGENDCIDGFYQHYEEKFVKIMNAFREDLNLYDVPFLLGGLGDFLAKCEPVANFDMRYYKDINNSLEKIAKEHEMTGFVSAKGLTSNPDYLHFDSKSLREFGLRYYEVFKKIENPDKVYVEKKDMDDCIRSESEPL